MVLNGDLLTDLDLTALAAPARRATGAVATLGLYPVDDPSSYGLVRRDEDGEVLGFLEKPDPDEIDTDEVNAGAYVLERSVLDLIPAGRAVSIEREVFPRLVGQGLYGRRLDGYWMDIGTPERYLQASWDILEGAVQTELDGHAAGRSSADGVEVAPDASVAPRAAVLRDRASARIARGDRATRCCSTTAGSSPGAEIRGSILAARGRGRRRAPRRRRAAWSARARGSRPAPDRRRVRGSSPARIVEAEVSRARSRPLRRSARSTPAASSTTSSRCPITCATRSGGSSRPGSSPPRPAA